MSVRRAALLQQARSTLHALLGFLQESRGPASLDERQQRPQDAPAVAAPGRRRRDGAGRSASGSMSICTQLGLARLGIELHVGKAAARDDQRVAFLHGVLRGRRAEQADAARGVRAVVGDHGLAQQRLDDRRQPAFSASAEHLLAGVQAAAAGQDGHLLAAVDDLGGGRAVPGPWASAGAAAIDVGAVALDVGLGALAVAAVPVLDVLGDGDVRAPCAATARS